MIIVAGHLLVEPAEREQYYTAASAARSSPGCLDFAITADLVDPGRIDILKRLELQAAVEQFRGNGPSDEQGAAVLGASMAEYDVADARTLM